MSEVSAKTPYENVVKTISLKKYPRATIAKRLHQSYSSKVHLTLSVKLDMSGVREAKEELKIDEEEELQEEADAEEQETKESDKEEPMPIVELPSNQLIVESFGGLLVRSDTVQISDEIMSQWEELLDGKDIEIVEVESFNGKTSQCKVKALDDSKLENKAVIRIPEKLCQTLDIKKGELVRVKPVIS